MTANSARKRVLLLSPFFFPEAISTGRYNSFLARSLVAANHKVDVIASHPLYPSWRPSKAVSTLDGVTIWRGGHWIRYPKSAIGRRAVLEVWYALHVIWTGLRRRSNEPYDVAVVVFPPVLAGLVPRWLFNSRRHIALVHDIQSIMAKTGGPVFHRVASGLLRKCESAALWRCDKIICLSDGMKEALESHLRLPESRISVCYPFSTLTTGNSSDRALEDLFPPGMTHIVYSGALGDKQRPDFLLDLFRAVCMNATDVCCHIFSGGPAFERLRLAHGSTVQERVMFHDLVPDSNLQELYGRSHVQVIVQAPGIESAAFPSKLPNILTAGVPVFAICAKDSDVVAVLHKCSAGIASDSEDIPLLTESLICFAAMQRDPCSRIARERIAAVAKGMFDPARLIQEIEGA